MAVQSCLMLKALLGLAYVTQSTSDETKQGSNPFRKLGLSDSIDPAAAMLTRRPHTKVANSSNKQSSNVEMKRNFETDPLEADGRNVYEEQERNLASCAGSNPPECGCQEVNQSDYRGMISTTVRGFTCREWTQAHNYPGHGLDFNNNCRNPNQVAERAWCFVDDIDVLWDYCDVPLCAATAPAETIEEGCIDTETYKSIDADIESIKNKIDNDVERSHFVGGIVRLVAHDFMDHDFNNEPHLGADGCLEFNNPSNIGLETIWCDTCSLKMLYESKYSRLSRADFFVAAGNAVIRQTSIDNELDLIHTFYWGRETRDECPDASLRLPSTKSCLDVEGVFLERMGLQWKDAVALLGAHTLGRGNMMFSGHHGTWVPNDEKAQVFDKTYYEELFRRAWRPRDVGTIHQDWTTGTNVDSPKMMLNTDMCLLYNIENNFPCCSRTNIFKSNGDNRCEDDTLSENECWEITENHSRFAAAQAVKKFLGGSGPNTNNKPFYDAFTIAWFKATTNGMTNLKPIRDQC